MDIFVTVMLVAMVLLVVVVGAAVFVQQSSNMRDILHKLDLVQARSQKLKDPEVLRRERVAILDPLMLVESQLYAMKPQQLLEEEIELISTSRARVIEISDEIKKANDWIGAPYDLEWFEYIERMPLIKTLYLAAELEQVEPAKITSGSSTATSPRS